MATKEEREAQLRVAAKIAKAKAAKAVEAALVKKALDTVYWSEGEALTRGELERRLKARREPPGKLEASGFVE